MKQLIKSITSVFSTKIINPKIEHKDYLNVKLINNSDDEDFKLHNALGISEDRRQVLMDLVENTHRRCAEKDESIVSCMEVVSKKLVHANELFFCTCHLNRINRPSHPFADIFQIKK